MFKLLKKAYLEADKTSFTALTAVLILLIAAEIVATVLIPEWRKYFFNGVEAKNWDVFVSGMWYFTALMGTFVIAQGFKQFTIQRLALIWRTALTKLLAKRYMRGKMSGKKSDNPDQRIAEDTNIASVLAIELLVEVIISFSIILGLVGHMSSTLLVLSAIYTAVIVGLALLFHRPMVNSEKDLQRAEADYRFKLATIVTKREKESTRALYGSVIARFKRLINVTLAFNLFSRAKGNLMNLIPYALLIPMYFAGDIGFGEVMEGVSQFDLLVINATILIILYPKVTKALASYERIKEFYDELNKGDKVND